MNKKLRPCFIQKVLTPKALETVFQKAIKVCVTLHRPSCDTCYLNDPKSVQLQKSSSKDFSELDDLVKRLNQLLLREQNNPTDQNTQLRIVCQMPWQHQHVVSPTNRRTDVFRKKILFLSHFQACGNRLLKTFFCKTKLNFVNYKYVQTR